jgi:YesN/AraC family two-component response regulator
MDSAQPLPSFSLLLVEDDDTTRTIVTRIVSSKFPECTIYAAENGKKGLQLFKEHTPDLVVTDINMPEMDGIEMARHIKAINPDAAYIVLSGNSDAKSITKFGEIGFCAYLVKPLEFKALFDAIANCHQEVEQQRERERVLAATTDA